MFFTSRGFSFFWDVVILNRNRTETTFLPVQKRKEIAMANMYRDVNLSEVNESYIGKELKVQCNLLRPLVMKHKGLVSGFQGIPCLSSSDEGMR